MDCGQPIAGRQIDDRSLLHLGEAVGSNDKSADALLNRSLECVMQVILISYVQ